VIDHSSTAAERSVPFEADGEGAQTSMARRALTAAASLAGALALIGCTAGGWQPMTGSVEHCVERAKLAMRDSDFMERFAIYPGPGETILYGQHGGYRAELYCTAGAPGIRVEVKGSDPVQTERYKESIIRRF
jgi:hypothetical protein